MLIGFKHCASAVLLAGSSLARPVHAQDSIAIQTMVEQSLFEVRGRVDRNAVAARRRTEAITSANQQRAARQNAMLETQAAAVERLADEVRTLKDERELSRILDAFDTGLASNDRVTLRSLFSDVVSVDERTVPADVLVSELRRQPPRAAAGMPRRSDVRVRIDGDRAVLISTENIGRRFGVRSRSTDRRLGESEYRFARVADSWRIDGLTFRSR